MTALPSLSVIVVTYRREKVLRDTIKGLLQQAYPEWELLIVDQSPFHEPETRAFLAALPPPARVLHLDRTGMCYARNRGILETRGDVVLFCDDDVIPGKDLLVAHARHYGDPRVGGVTGPDHLDLKRAKGPLYMQSDCEVAVRPVPDTAISVDSVVGCNMSFRRRALVEVGGFDEGFIGRAHREETDASWRVRDLGYRLLYDPAARVEHLAWPSGGSRSDQEDESRYVYGWFHNNAYFFAKHCRVWGLLPFFAASPGSPGLSRRLAAAEGSSVRSQLAGDGRRILGRGQGSSFVSELASGRGRDGR
jgi:Predicted glycosyltransferases